MRRVFSVAKLEASLSLVHLKCQAIRPQAKRQELKRQNEEYAIQKGRFLTKSEFSSLFDNVVNHLETVYYEKDVPIRTLRQIVAQFFRTLD